MTAANLAGIYSGSSPTDSLGNWAPAHTQLPAIETPSDCCSNLLPNISAANRAT